MYKYTVIGIYDDTAQVFCEDVKAKDAYAAMGKIARKSVKAGTGGYLCILGAFLNPEAFFPASDETGKAGYACDIALCPAA